MDKGSKLIVASAVLSLLATQSFAFGIGGYGISTPNVTINVNKSNPPAVRTVTKKTTSHVQTASTKTETPKDEESLVENYIMKNGDSNPLKSLAQIQLKAIVPAVDEALITLKAIQMKDGRAYYEMFPEDPSIKMTALKSVLESNKFILGNLNLDNNSAMTMEAFNKQAAEKSAAMDVEALKTLNANELKAIGANLKAVAASANVLKISDKGYSSYGTDLETIVKTIDDTVVASWGVESCKSPLSLNESSSY